MKPGARREYVGKRDLITGLEASREISLDLA